MFLKNPEPGEAVDAGNQLGRTLSPTERLVAEQAVRNLRTFNQTCRAAAEGGKALHSDPAAAQVWTDAARQTLLGEGWCGIEALRL